MQRPGIEARLAIPLACLVLSGMAGLMAEVVWSRALAALFGSALTATGLLLGLFMVGLGVGSALGGCLARSMHRPLLGFAAVEIAIGVVIFQTPRYFRFIEPWVKELDTRVPDSMSAIVPALLTLPILGPIVVLMGATFPLFVAHVASSRSRLGGASGIVYGVNTFGAVVGAVLAGFWLLPALGISMSLRLAASLDLFVGVTTLVVALVVRSRIEEDNQLEAVSIDSLGHSARNLAMLVAFLGGMAALTLEVAWFRALMLIFGSSVYAISLMLAAFLLGLAGGAALLVRREESVADARPALGRIHWQIAFSSTIVTFAVQVVPLAYIALLSESRGAFGLLTAGSFAMILVLLAVPTLLMGAALPLAIRLAAEDRAEHAAHEAGKVYAASSIGSSAGALLAGFVLMPQFGVRGAVAFAVACSLFASILLLRTSAGSTARRPALQASVVLILLWAGWLGNLLPWDWRVLTGGYYAYAHLYTKNQAPATGPTRRETALVTHVSFAASESGLRFKEPVPGAESRLVSWEDGRLAQVAVVDDGGVRSLLLNGKADASNGTDDMRTQLLLAHLPALLGPASPRGDAMVIGLGSGVTAGAVASWPYERVMIAEIEPAVVRASRWFEAENHRVLDNARTKLHVDDARRILDRSKGKYSLITSEPSNLWMSGVSLLFTREFFELAAARLDDHGVFCQWIHLYQVGERDVATLFASMSGSFPHMVVFADGSDLLIVASKSPLTLDPEEWKRRIDGNSQGSAMLAAVGIRSAADIAGGIVSDERGVRRWSAGAELHTDDRPILEFTAARRMGFDESAAILSSLVRTASEAGPIEFGASRRVGGRSATMPNG